MFCHIINKSRLRWLVWWSNDSHDTSWRSQTAALSHAVLRKSRTICQPFWRWKQRSSPIARAWSLALQYLRCRKPPSTGPPTIAANEIGMEFKKHCAVPSKGAIMGIMGLQSLNFKRLTFKYGFSLFYLILLVILPLLHMVSMHKGACSVADCSPTIK